MVRNGLVWKFTSERTVDAASEGYGWEHPSKFMKCPFVGISQWRHVPPEGREFFFSPQQCTKNHFQIKSYTPAGMHVMCLFDTGHQLLWTANIHHFSYLQPGLS